MHEAVTSEGDEQLFSEYEYQAALAAIRETNERYSEYRELVQQ